MSSPTSLLIEVGGSPLYDGLTWDDVFPDNVGWVDQGGVCLGIAALSSHLVYAISAAGYLWEYVGGAWSQLDASLTITHVSVASDGTVYAVSGGVLKRWTGAGWTNLTGTNLVSIAAASSTTAYGVTSAGSIYKRTTSWVLVSSSPAITKISVAADGTLWATQTSDGALLRWNGAAWVSVGGVCKELTGLNATTAYVIGNDDHLWQNTSGNWSMIDGSLPIGKVSVAPTGVVFALKLVDNTLTRWGTRTWEDGVPAAYLSAFIGSNSGISLSTFSLEDAVGEHSICSLTAISTGLGFEKGQNVVVRDDTCQVIFGGFVDSVITTPLPGASGYFFHDMSISDWHYLAQKRLVYFALEHPRIDEAVAYIYDNYLYAEGVRMGYVETGETVEQTVFSYIPASESLDRLAEYSGSVWFISSDRKLYFYSRDKYSAPFILTKSHMAGEVPELTNQSVEYRNKQFIRGGQDKTDLQTEEFVGDGHQRTWTVYYPIGEPPSVWVDGVPQVVGIFGESGVDFIWSSGSNQTTQDTAASPISDGLVIRVEYIGLYNIMAVTSSPYEIYSRQILEGVGSGTVECIADEPYLSTKDAAIERAMALIDRYGKVGRKVAFKTRTRGLACGQLLKIDIAELGLTTTAPFLITHIELLDQGGALFYQIEACEGPVEESVVAVFARMMGKKDVTVLRDEGSLTSSLIGLYSFYKLWDVGENPNIFDEVFAGDATFASTPDWPCFDPGDRLKYVVLEDAVGNELVRKYRTSQTADADSIATIISVGYDEGIGSIAKASLWGGNLCSAITDSGIELSAHTWSKVKTGLESLQLEFLDDKW